MKDEKEKAEQEVGIPGFTKVGACCIYATYRNILRRNYYPRKKTGYYQKYYRKQAGPFHKAHRNILGAKIQAITI